jgi:hypothetical protein
MANPWFRLYSEFSSDPKIQSMSEPMQRRLVMLFCLRCGNVLETLQENEIVFALGISEEEWKETKELFVSKCFIRFIKGKCNITNWNKRQFISDSSTDRVRKYRANKETLPQRSESVTVTPPDSYPDSDSDHIQKQEKKKEIPVFSLPKLQSNPMNAKDGNARIELARALWNTKAPAIGPACRLMAITFKPEDTTDCRRIMSAYSDEDILQAIDNYAQILMSLEHEVKSPYQSFVGFIRGGVEKFVTDAAPFEAFKKRAKGFESAGEREERERAEGIARINAMAGG